MLQNEWSLADGGTRVRIMSTSHEPWVSKIGQVFKRGHSLSASSPVPKKQMVINALFRNFRLNPASLALGSNATYSAGSIAVLYMLFQMVNAPHGCRR